MRFSDYIGIVILIALGALVFTLSDGVRKVNRFFASSIPVEYIPELVLIEIKNGAEKSQIYVGKYEVTLEQWKYCYQSGGCSYMPKTLASAKDDHPVTGVNWADVNEYIKWLSKNTKEEYRLPTAKEWAFIADDVVDNSDEKLFDDPRLAWAADYINYEQKSRVTKTIGSFGENRFGIYDLSGNVWEWASDCWQSSDEKLKTKSCRTRVILGEHQGAMSDFIRNPIAGGCSIGLVPSNLGFRIIKSYH